MIWNSEWEYNNQDYLKSLYEKKVSGECPDLAVRKHTVEALRMSQVPKSETYITRNATEKHQNDVFHNQLHRREMNHMSLRSSFFAVVPDGIHDRCRGKLADDD